MKNIPFLAGDYVFENGRMEPMTPMQKALVHGKETKTTIGLSTRNYGELIY